MHVGPHELEANQHGEHKAHQPRRQRQQKILDANYFVVNAEDIFPDEARRRFHRMRGVSAMVVRTHSWPPGFLLRVIRSIISFIKLTGRLTSGMLYNLRQKPRS